MLWMKSSYQPCQQLTDIAPTAAVLTDSILCWKENLSSLSVFFPSVADSLEMRPAVLVFWCCKWDFWVAKASAKSNFAMHNRSRANSGDFIMYYVQAIAPSWCLLRFCALQAKHACKAEVASKSMSVDLGQLETYIKYFRGSQVRGTRHRTSKLAKRASQSRQWRCCCQRIITWSWGMVQLCFDANSLRSLSSTTIAQ